MKVASHRNSVARASRRDESAQRRRTGGTLSIQQTTASGREVLLWVSRLLQRARRASPAGPGSAEPVFEAADAQWWWRRPRESDSIDQLFWVDDAGPVGGVWLTTWDAGWQCDPITVPGAPIDRAEVWERALEQAGAHAPGTVTIPVGDGDDLYHELARAADLTAASHDSTGWLDAGSLPVVEPPPAGFTLVDRTMRPDRPHPMRQRNGDAVEERLRTCPLYDPELDLSVEAEEGEPAAYSLFWLDPTTKVGLVEPVRVDETFWRRGLARAMLTEGLDRLARKGAVRVKISYGSEAAGTLYRRVGFRPTSRPTWYERRPLASASRH